MTLPEAISGATYMQAEGFCLMCMQQGLLTVMPDAFFCIAAHAENMQQQLERMTQSSHAASRQAAKPLSDMLSLGLVLTYIWAECVHISTGHSGSIKPHPDIASVTRAVSDGYHFTTVAAIITAGWSCDAILQECMTAAKKSSNSPHSEKASLLLAGSCARAEAFVKTCAGVDCSLLKHTKPVAAASDQGWDAVLRVVIGFLGLRVAHVHSAQQGKPRAAARTARGRSAASSSAGKGGQGRRAQASTARPAAVDEDAAAVPSHHEALLQAVRLDPKQLQDVISDLSRPELPICLDAVNWALHQLHDHLKNPAGSAAQQGQPASTLRSSVLDPGAVSTEATSITQAGSSFGAAASMRLGCLLPPLLLVLAELAALQPEADVLDSVLTASSMCMAIAKLPAAAADPQQASSGPSSSRPPGSAVMQGVVHGCLELLPLQQQLAASHRRTDPKASAAQSASSAWDDSRLLDSVIGLLGRKPAALAASGLRAQLKRWEDQLFRLLGDSMTACATQHGVAAAWLLEGMSACTVFSRLEAAVRQDCEAEPFYTLKGVELAVKAMQIMAAGNSQQLMQRVSDSSNAAALLSLLLSCLKRLQHHSGYVDAAANVRLACEGMVAARGAVAVCSAQVTSTTGSPHVTRLPPSASVAIAAPLDSTSIASASSSNAGSCSSRTDCNALRQPGLTDWQSAQPASTQPADTASMWLLLAGRALYTTGVALQAALADRSRLFITRNQPMILDAPDALGNFPEQCLPCLQHCVVQLGSVLQQLVTSEGTAAVQGTKQLHAVLGRPVLDALNQLLAAAAAAANSACKLAEDPEAAALREARWWQHEGPPGGQVRPSVPPHLAGTRHWGHDEIAEDVTHTWQQLNNTGEGTALADSLLNFGSLLCAALPTRLCCNEPSCCCFDKPAEQQLAAGKASTCSACGAARYCGAADQRKHWKQHKPTCKAVAAAATALKAATASMQQAAPVVTPAAADTK